MESHASNRQQVSLVAQEMGEAIRRGVRGRPGQVRVADRNEGRRHVWRFRSGSDGVERFLYVAHSAMTRGAGSAAELMNQLERAEWMERLFGGPATSLVLSPSGSLKAGPKQ